MDLPRLSFAISPKACHTSVDEIWWLGTHWDMVARAIAPGSCWNVFAKMSICFAWAVQMVWKIALAVAMQTILADFVKEMVKAPTKTKSWTKMENYLKSWGHHFIRESATRHQ